MCAFLSLEQVFFPALSRLDRTWVLATKGLSGVICLGCMLNFLQDLRRIDCPTDLALQHNPAETKDGSVGFPYINAVLNIKLGGWSEHCLGFILLLPSCLFFISSPPFSIHGCWMAIRTLSLLSLRPSQWKGRTMFTTQPTLNYFTIRRKLQNLIQTKCLQRKQATHLWQMPISRTQLTWLGFLLYTHSTLMKDGCWIHELTSFPFLTSFPNPPNLLLLPATSEV